MERISEGGFVVEPGNLWRRRVKRRRLDDAPRIASEGGVDVFICPGEPPTRTPVESVPWRQDPLASSDAWLRPEAMDRAGIQAQVLFPTFGWALLGIGDRDLRNDCMRAYNNWLADLCTASSSRLQAAVLIPPGAEGPSELEHCLNPITQAAVNTVILCVDGASDVEPVLRIAKARGLAVVFARAGGASPLGDVSRFTQETAELARNHAAPGLDAVVPHWQGGAKLKLERIAAS